MPHDWFAASLMLVALGFALRMTLQLLYGARGPSPDDGIYLFIRILSWGLIIIPSMLFFIGTTTWLAPLLLVAVVESVIELFVARRSAQRQSLWQLLLMSLTSGRPLADSLRYHQARFNGSFGRRFRRLLADLDRGISWNYAVGNNRGLFPPEAPSYAALLATSPTVAADAQSLVKPRDAAYVEVRQQIVQRLSYLGLAAFMMLAVSSFVMIKIVPSFQMIFEDFDLELPHLTIFVINVGGWFEQYMLAPLVMIVLALFLASAAIGILYLCGVPVLRPVIDRLTFSYHEAQILRLLAVAFRQGLPVSEAFKRLEAGIGAYSSPLARRRLQSAHSIALSGRTWIDALRTARLITGSDAASLAAAQQVGNLPWAMEFLADRKMRLLGFNWSAVITVLFTFIVLCFGFMVFWFAVAMFIPLINLIMNMSS